MDADAVFRPYVIGIFVAIMAIALPFRIKSQSTGEKLDRTQEGLFIMVALRLAGAALWIGAIAFMINPASMAWSSLALPSWIRWIGVAVGVVTPLLLAWTLKTLGPNLTDTVVTRQAHTLVTRGPYRWVRHPFYVCMVLFTLSIALTAANWFLAVTGIVVFILLATRSRTEEDKLLARFGEPYRAYQAQTGRFLPRLVLLGAVVAGLSTLAPLAAQERVTFTALSVGNRFSCGLSADGTAYCWGADAMGQLGIGDPVGRCEESIYAKGACARAPVAVSGDHRFTSISAGDSHTCAIDDEGAVYCWGENDSGQLGISSTPDRCVRESSRNAEENMTLACSRRPVRVPLEAPIVSIATGENMTCAAGESGEVWCWGGHPTRATPALLDVEDRFATLDAGGHDVCGLTVDDTLRCFTWADVLTEGVTAPWDSADWQAVTVGMRHACALDTEGGAFCWGSDADGALGIGPNAARHSYDEVAVTPVLGDQVFRSLETGTIRTCGIRDDGALYCWGRVPEEKADEQCLDSNGVAGTNDCTSRPIPVHQATRFAAVAIGARHQCGLSTSGVTLCWGDNESGQLGDGTLRSTDQLVEVRTGGVTLEQTQLLDARENIVRWGPRGGAALLVLFGLIFAGRRWWRAGAGAQAPRVDPDWMAAGALAAVLVGWLMFGAAILSIGTSTGTGDVAYGLAMMVLITGGGGALALSAIAAVMASVVLRRNRGAKVARLALVLAILTLVVATAAALKMFWPTER